jgi:uncharacterized phage infection (PIP) family protein YhgE
MAIQTKKISELGSITNLEGEVYFLGTSGGVTGRISKSDLETNILKEVKDSIAQITEEIAAIKNTQTSLIESVTTISNKPSTVAVECDCEEKITALTEKIAKLEGFVQALQKNSYLTLAEVKKAAAEACPISAE